MCVFFTYEASEAQDRGKSHNPRASPDRHACTLISLVSIAKVLYLSPNHRNFSNHICQSGRKISFAPRIFTNDLSFDPWVSSSALPCHLLGGDGEVDIDGAEQWLQGSTGGQR